MKSEFAVRMGKLRRGKGLSQRQAAEKLGISQALLSHYENGAREPKLEFISILCDFYEVTADYLLGRSANKESGVAILSGKVRELVTTLEVLRSEESELLSGLAKLVDKDDDT